MCECKFYEIDLTAQKEAEDMEADYIVSTSPEEREAMEAWAAQAGENFDPFVKCGAYCKHMKEGKGHPGEYIYGCAAPGNEHIIHVDFNESEII